MTIGAAYGIWYTAQRYLSAKPTQGKIEVNDMSLPFGGLFDINNNWNAPHSSHSRGTSVDVRANGLGSFSIPTTKAGEMVDDCVFNGSVPGHGNSFYEAPGTDFAHVHCRWPDPA
jgi:hypothetical protein